MPGWEGAWRAAATLVVVVVALGGCSKPQWARGEKAPEPALAAAQPAPAGPASPTVQSVPGMADWAVALLGKSPRDAFGKNGVCLGSADGIHHRPAGTPGLELYGWAWDVAAKHRVERVILVDAGYVIVGGGVTGTPRPDVPRVFPQIPDGATGWKALTSMTSGPVDAFGIVAGGTAICPLGHLEL